jgi:hypothetical protein
MTVAPAPSEFEAAGDDRVYGDIHCVADDVRSLAISLREAAWRGDRLMVRILRAEFRQQAVLLLGLIRDIAPLEGELAGDAKRKGRREQ